MAAKQIAFDQEAREAMRRGIGKLARAVRVTLGPKGRNVIIQKSFGSPTVTKDGVTVAKEIELPDHYENMGARMVKEGDTVLFTAWAGDEFREQRSNDVILVMHEEDVLAVLDE